MANGNALDPTSSIGEVRLTVGDDVPNTDGDYLFSDAAITVALSLAGDSVLRAVATLIKQLALAQTMAGQSIKADDFSINSTNRGRDLMQVALSYEREADAAEQREAAGEMVIVSTRIRRPGDHHFAQEDTRLREDPEREGFFLP